MDKYVLKNTFVKIYIYHFLINIFIETRSSSYLVIAFMICFFNFMGKKKKEIRTPFADVWPALTRAPLHVCSCMFCSVHLTPLCLKKKRGVESAVEGLAQKT